MRKFGWLRELVKSMKESLRTGLRFTPTDRDINNLEEILKRVNRGKVKNV